mmetsp:Transcript_14115/g.12463  ORF Transcript_14115/g.12463 Transcript_14115/m.12463 type:complete len:102 (+) Transcript_14115:169-474(+)
MTVEDIENIKAANKDKWKELINVEDYNSDGDNSVHSSVPKVNKYKQRSKALMTREAILKEINDKAHFKSLKLDQKLVQMKLTPGVYNISKPKEWKNSAISK